MKIRFLVPPAIFAAALAFFYPIQFSTQNIPGFDGFYHIKLASIISHQGIVHEFPWFWHTPGGFIDIHFLYHLLLVPFTSVDLIEGAKLSTVVFFSIFSVVFYYALKTSKVPLPWVWLALCLIISTEFLYRMSLPRAPLVALSFLFMGACLVAGGKYKAVFFLTFAFVWLYGGFTLFVLLACFIVLSQWVVERRVDDRSLAAVLLGAAAGLVVNPYFPENAFFLFAQTFSAGVDRMVPGGEEWKPYGAVALLTSHLSLVFLLAATASVFASVRKKPRPDTLGWVLFLILVICLTLRSRRFVEYLVPVAVMAGALLFRDGWRESPLHSRFTSRGIGLLVQAALVAALLFIGGRQIDAAKKELRDPRATGRYQQAALWLKTHTPGSTIFNTDWDDFPELFFYNSRNRYVAGLDPAFLYLYDQSLYRKWVDISQGALEGDPYPVLRNDFKTPYLFTDLRHGRFIRLMEKHPLIELVYKDAHAHIYRLRKK
ncbi:MAG: hypothetical protein ACE5G9_08805 [Nitrospinales bacterium]